MAGHLLLIHQLEKEGVAAVDAVRAVSARVADVLLYCSAHAGLVLEIDDDAAADGTGESPDGCEEQVTCGQPVLAQ